MDTAPSIVPFPYVPYTAGLHFSVARYDRGGPHLGSGSLFVIVAAFGKCVRGQTHLPQHSQLQHGRLELIVTTRPTVMLSSLHSFPIHRPHLTLLLLTALFRSPAVFPAPLT